MLPALSEQAQSRFERVFEYDSLSDRYSRFLLEELIPEVAKKYNLSKNPNDRALSGVSTGAVGAFMAAWNRPDQFHRVLSFIGTFVAMKGADGLPALIRKTEPKPIRIFLQDGKNDHVVPTEPYGTFYAGSWPINNQVMYEAFQSAGYDVKLVIGEEGHNMKQGAAIMPEALRWLWRGYPEPIVAGSPRTLASRGGIRAAKSIPSSPPIRLGAGRAKLTAPWRAPPATRTATYTSPTPPPIGFTNRTRTAKCRSSRTTPAALVPSASGPTAGCMHRNRPAAHRVLRPRRRRKSGGAKCRGQRPGDHGQGRDLLRGRNHKTIGYIDAKRESARGL